MMLPHPEADEPKRAPTASAVAADDSVTASSGQVAGSSTVPDGADSAASISASRVAEDAAGSIDPGLGAKVAPVAAPRRRSSRFAPRRHGQQATPPNEFTFGWSDVEWDSPADGALAPVEKEEGAPRRLDGAPACADGDAFAAPIPGEHSVGIEDGAGARSAPAVPGRRLRPNGAEPEARDVVIPQATTPIDRTLTRQMAEQAAHTSDRVAAVGLIAASVALALDSREMTDPTAPRLAAAIVRAASWLTWRLHDHPRTRARLVRLPQSVILCAPSLFARARRGDPPSTSRIAAMLYRQMQEPSAENLVREGRAPSPRSPNRSLQRRRDDRTDAWAREW